MENTSNVNSSYFQKIVKPCPKITVSGYLLLFIVVVLAGCSSTRRLEKKMHNETYHSLGLEESRKDNFELYKEVASWLYTPHVDGGLSHSGVDCSGFVYMVYKKVYGKTLERNAANILKKNCRKINRSHLREGDLVFFNTAGKGKSSVNHVGIYLKEGGFAHTSSSRGVMVSNLDENYFSKTWICGGRVKD
ncbi:MAG TPA: NlpC/P60 family protein [Paludibacter sp.]|nr:NlpC/P60 family protein [Paludibacter sp.]